MNENKMAAMVATEFGYGEWLIKLSPKGAKLGMEYRDIDDQTIIHERVHHKNLEDAVAYIKSEYKDEYDELIKDGHVTYDSAVVAIYPDVVNYGFEKKRELQDVVVIDTILDLHRRFAYEMAAESTWSGHAYATEYFSLLRTRIIDTAKDIEEAYSSEIKEAASKIEDEMKTDYDALISKVFDNNTFASWDKRQIAAALNSAFIDKLEIVFSIFSFIYEKITGKKYDECFEQYMNS